MFRAVSANSHRVACSDGPRHTQRSMLSSAPQPVHLAVRVLAEVKTNKQVSKHSCVLCPPLYTIAAVPRISFGTIPVAFRRSSSCVAGLAAAPTYTAPRTAQCRTLWRYVRAHTPPKKAWSSLCRNARTLGSVTRGVLVPQFAHTLRTKCRCSIGNY
jgi:hypothetical protein